MRTRYLIGLPLIAAGAAIMFALPTSEDGSLTQALFFAGVACCAIGIAMILGNNTRKRFVKLDGTEYLAYVEGPLFEPPLRDRGFSFKLGRGKRRRVYADASGLKSVEEIMMHAEYAQWWEAMGEPRDADDFEKRVFGAVFTAV